MAEKSITTNDDDQHVVQSEIKEKSKAIKTATKPKSKEIEIVFKYNRSFDLHVGRQVFHFAPKEGKKVNSTVTLHKDFNSVKDYFVIKE